jgi:hypothetical protein
MGAYLMGVYLMGVHLARRAPHGRLTGRAPHWACASWAWEKVLIPHRTVPTTAKIKGCFLVRIDLASSPVVV